MEPGSLKNHFLIAMPTLADPNFFKPPAAPVAMPCEVPQRDLYTPLGLFMAIPEEAEKIRLMSRKTIRNCLKNI